MERTHSDSNVSRFMFSLANTQLMRITTVIRVGLFVLPLCAVLCVAAVLFDVFVDSECIATHVAIALFSAAPVCFYCLVISVWNSWAPQMLWIVPGSIYPVVVVVVSFITASETENGCIVIQLFTLIVGTGTNMVMFYLIRKLGVALGKPVVVGPRGSAVVEFDDSEFGV